MNRAGRAIAVEIRQTLIRNEAGTPVADERAQLAALGLSVERTNLVEVETVD